MNAARSAFRPVYLLLLNRGTVLTEAPVVSKRIPALPPLLLPPRSVSQFFRAMATNNAGEKSTDNKSIGNMEESRKTKAKESRPMRRIKSKQKRLKSADKRSPTTVYVQVVGAGSRDTSASIFVFSDYNRYLFNCGEGTQRLMMEHKLKAASLDNIFLTRMSWENVGGLSGMILTLKDIGVTECALSGPPQLESYLRAIKSFSGPLDTIRLTVNPYTDNTYSDETMSVTQVPVYARANSPTNSTQASSRTDDDRPKTTRGSSLVVAFICKLHPKPGNFLLAEAKELGLPVGTGAIRPFIYALKAGQTVEYEGKQIRPEQVCTPTEPGPVFLVVECPSEEFIPGVCTNEQLQRHASGTEDPAALVVHFTPESVLGSEPYQRWMESFPSSTKHLILNEHASGVHYLRSCKLQTQLHMVHPEVFPPLQDYRTREPQAALRVPSVRAECLLKFQLRPTIGWDREAIPVCDEEQFVAEAAELPLFLEEVDHSKKLWSKQEPQNQGLAEQYPEVMFLGTGSALPNKTRNVSGTLLNISSSQSVLLDCGEGTFGQLCRHYGDEVDQALSKINTIFISHMHADHHTGLLKLLYERERALSSLGKQFSPVFLLGPDYIMSWLGQYNQACEEILRHVSFISNKSLSRIAEGKRPSIVSVMLQNAGLNKMETCPVRHCKQAFGCYLTHDSGWSLVFSGDTMPCEALVEIGRGATLLIHEATLEDALEEEAMEKRHSTTSQAIDIGMRMNAEFIMLNHFSQRYAKIPLFSPDFSDRVGISFDHMRVRFRDLKLLPFLTPALKTLFAEDLTEMKEMVEKRERKNQGLYLQTGGAKRQADSITADAQSKRLKAQQ